MPSLTSSVLRKSTNTTNGISLKNNNHRDNNNNTTTKVIGDDHGGGGRPSYNSSSNNSNSRGSGPASVTSSLTTGSVTTTKEADKFAALAEEVLKNEAIIKNSNDDNNRHRKIKKPKMQRGTSATPNNVRVPFVGRERELDDLNETLDSLFVDHNSMTIGRKEEGLTDASSSSPSVICISGPGGTGKSFLVQQLKSNVLDRDGYFIRGKFTTRGGGGASGAGGGSGGTPAYSGLTMAIQDLVEQILHRDFDMGIRRRLEETFSVQDASALIEIFPCLSSVLADEEISASNGNNTSSKSFNFSGAFSTASTNKLYNNNSNKFGCGDGGPSNKTQASNNNNNKTQKAKQRQFLFTQLLRVLISSNETYVDEDIVKGDDRNSACTPQNYGNDAQSVEPSTPLVLVLDDVQWIDPPSMELISALIKEQAITTTSQKNTKQKRQQPFLLLCTSRPNQKNNSDNLFGREMQSWEKITSTQHIQLGNLSTDDIHTILISFLGISSTQEQEEQDFLVDGSSTTSTISTLKSSTNTLNTLKSSTKSINTFKSSTKSISTLRSATSVGNHSSSSSSNSSADTQSLAEIIQQKTKGNAFFVIEFIKALIDQELLFFNYGSLSWKWDIRKVQSLVVMSSDNNNNNNNNDNNNNALVNYLLTTKLHNQLTLLQQFTLIVATCLGGSFDRGLMETILHQISSTLVDERDGGDFLEFYMDKTVKEQKQQPKEKRPTKTTTDIKSTLQDLVDLGFLTSSCGNNSNHDNQTEQTHKRDGGSNYQIYFFSHDLIKQAVGALMTSTMSDTRSHLLNYRIGECILENLVGQSSRRSSRKMEQPEKPYDDCSYYLDASNDSSNKLFLGTDLLDQSIDHVIAAAEADDDERATVTTDRIQLAAYNLFAGEAAMSESAFAAGLRYMETGLRLLEDEAKEDANKKGQQQHEHLLTNLLSGAAEAHYCTGSYTAVGTYTTRILQTKNCNEEVMLKMYYLNCQSAFAEFHFKECLDSALIAIRKMGVVRFPSNPNKLHLLYEFMKTRRLLRNHTLGSLKALPLMDPIAHARRINTMQIIDGAVAASYFQNKNFLLVGAMISLRWTLKYGVSRFSPEALAKYGVIVLALFGDVEASTMAGEAAIAMSERIGLPEIKAKVSILVFPFLHHWSNDMRTCIPPLAYAHRLAMECGDTFTAISSLWYMDKINWGSARVPLSVLAGDLKQHCAKSREYNHGSSHDAMLFLAQRLQRLCIDATDFAWVDETTEIIAERHGTSFADRKNDPLVRTFVAFVLLQVHVLLKEHGEALRWAKQITTKGAMKICMGQTYLPHILFFRSLVLLSLASEGKRARQNLREVNLMLKVMRSWRSKGSINVQHMICLLEAEIARIQSKNDVAKQLYGEAIQMAIRCGHIHDAGICNESAAIFYLGLEERQRAAHHIQQAVKCFRDWGASAVVDRIIRAHGDLMPNSTFRASSPPWNVPAD